MGKIELPDALKEMFRKEGRKGGIKGRKKRWAGVPAAERSEAARKAAQARWSKTKKKQERQ